MIIIFQFPISDTRLFDSEQELRLPIPDWENLKPEFDPQFVKYFGKAVERRLQPDEAWSDEIKFCQANRALKFVELEKHHLGLSEADFRPKCAFRRLFYDGQTVARVEIGLKHHNQTLALSLLKPHQLLSIILDICNLPTTVPQINNTSKVISLIKQGTALAKLYADGTISQHANIKSRARELIEAGNPLIFIELKSHEADFPLVPQGFIYIPADKVLGANLAYGRVKTKSGVVNTWILQRGKATKEQARSLRLCILRLHAEQESLDITLNQIKRKRLIISSEQTIVDEFDKYFNEKIKLINRAKYAGINQSAILEAFDACGRVTLPATRKNLINRYEGARNQVWKKIDDYQIRRAATRFVATTELYVEGDMIVKHSEIKGNRGIVFNDIDFMSNVTATVNNNLENSSSTDEVKALIKQLTDQITAISSQVDDTKQIERMGKNIKKLSEEIAEPEPDRKWYELSIEGLKEAAVAVGEIGIPIIETLKKLGEILLLA